MTSIAAPTLNITCSHKYTSKVIAPTCTSKGYTLHTCSVCGSSYKDNETNAKGDVNSDGKLAISDIVLLQKWLTAVPNVKLSDWKAADFTNDGVLNVFDLCMMKRELIRN